MADFTRTVDIIFGAVDQTGTVLSSLDSNLGKLEGSISSITSPIASITGSAIKLAAGIDTIALAAGGFAINEAVKFQSASLDLQKVLSEGEGSVEQYRKQIIELSNKFGVSATEVLGATADFRQAGFNIDESLEIVRVALTANKTINLEASDAAQLLIASLKGFQAPASNAAVILDQINEVSNNFAVSAGELLIGFSDLAPIAKLAGLSFEETIGILTPGIEVFQSGSEVARALRTSLLSLVDDSKPVQQALASLGVAQRDTNGELRDAGDILFDVGRAFESLTDAQKLETAAMIVGENQAGRFVATIRDMGLVSDVTATALEGVGTSAEKELAIRLGAAREEINRTRVAFENAAIAVGEKLLPQFKGSVQALGDVGRAFAAAVQEGALDDFLAGAGEILVEFELGFRTLAKNMPDILAKIDLTPFVASIENVLGSIEGIFDGIDLGTPEGMAEAIQLIIDAASGLNNIVSGVITSLKPFIDLLIAAADELGDLGTDAQTSIGEIFGLISDIDKLTPAIGVLGGILGTLGGTLTILSAAGGLGGTLAKGVPEAAAGISKLIGLLGGPAGLIALLGKGGLVAAAGAAGVGVGTLVHGLVEDSPAFQSITDKIFKAAEELGGFGAQAEIAEERARVLAESAEKTAKGLADTAVAGNEAEQALKGAGDSSKVLSGAFGAAGAEIVFLSERQQALAKSSETLSDAFNKGGASLDSAISEAVLLRFSEINKKYPDFIKAVREGIDPTQKAADAFGDIGAKSEETRLKLQELSTERFVTVIEARAEVNTAQINATRDIVIGAFDSINTTIESTGETITELFALLGSQEFREQTGGITENLLRDALEKEIDNREEALTLQREQIQAEIDLARTREQAIARGFSEITIRGDTLEPELRAFMNRIIEQIHIEATAEGAEFLLGLPSAA